jgi:hypothetical protein
MQFPVSTKQRRRDGSLCTQVEPYGPAGDTQSSLHSRKTNVFVLYPDKETRPPNP